MSFCRQNEAWQAFLPDGDRATWTSFDDDKTYGLIALKADLETTDPVETKKLRAAFKDFLNCMSVLTVPLTLPRLFREKLQAGLGL